MVRFRRRLLALLVPLAILAVLIAASTLWLEQQSARSRIAEAQLGPVLARAEAAEGRAARAEASLTAIADQQLAMARATATAVAAVNEPQRALERGLGRLFAAFQDPTGSSFDQLGESFSPGALEVLRTEVDYLRSSARHLGGASTFSIDAAPIQRIGEDRVAVHTSERWLYDERDESDRQQRCFIEDSDQTYTLRLADRRWLIDEVRLGATRRSDCPPGT